MKNVKKSERLKKILREWKKEIKQKEEKRIGSYMQ